MRLDNICARPALWPRFLRDCKDFLPDSSILVAILRLIDFLRLLVIPSLSLFGRDSTPPCPTDYDQAFSSLGPTTSPAMRF